MWARLSPAHGSWAESGPAQQWWAESGLVKKCMFKILRFPRVYCFTLFCLISICFFFSFKKNTNPILKYPVFVKTFKNTKKLKKEKNVFVHTAKCLKAKKSYCVFHTPKKQCFSMHFGFNNQFIKVKRTLAKISKTTKISFCLSFSI
jgi:hypothetical protein